MDYKRVFIEKKITSNEGRVLLKEFKDYLKIQSLKDVRVVNVYDLIGATNEIAEKVTDKVLYEEKLDLIYKKVPMAKDEKAFRIKYQRGQFNQRQDSALESANKFVLEENIDIVHTKIIILKGVDEKDLEKIKSY